MVFPLATLLWGYRDLQLKGLYWRMDWMMFIRRLKCLSKPQGSGRQMHHGSYPSKVLCFGLNGSLLRESLMWIPSSVGHLHVKKEIVLIVPSFVILTIDNPIPDHSFNTGFWSFLKKIVCEVGHGLQGSHYQNTTSQTFPCAGCVYL